MVLTDISVRRKHLTALRFSEDYVPIGAEKSDDGCLLIDSEYCAQKNLKCGQSFTEQEIDELSLESQKLRAKSKALWLLSRRDYSSGELQKKLKEKFTCEAADHAGCRMVELGLVNDLVYAKHLAETLINIKGVAPRQAPYLMAQKGVELSLAKEVVLKRQDDPRETIRRLIETKYARKLNEPRGTEKVFAALQRKGFSFADIRAVLELACNEFTNE